MKLNSKIIFSVIFLFVLYAVFFLTPKTVTVNEESKSLDLNNYDIRMDKGGEAKTAIAQFIERSSKSAQTILIDRKKALDAEEDLRRQVADLKIEYNEDLQIPEVVSRNSEFLTAPNKKKRDVILKDFIQPNADLFGMRRSQIDRLEKTADYTNPDGDLSFVHFEQKINSIPVFRGELKAGFSRTNEIVRIINNLAPNLDYEALPTEGSSAEEAVLQAAKFVGLEAKDADVRRILAESNELKVTFERGQFSDRSMAEKMYFPIDHGAARLAWRVLLWTNGAAFYVIVDAETGTLLWRKNLTEHQTQTATFNVYGNTTSMMKTADNPSPFTPGCLDANTCPQPPILNRTNFTLIGNEPPYDFNNLGWINDGENRTIGNNVEAGIDRIPPNGIDPDGWAFGNPYRVFNYTYNPAPGNPPPGEAPVPTMQMYPPSQFQQGSVTHIFYTVNRWHDEMYLLGFTEPARNFQTDNFGRGGLGNDSIAVNVQTFGNNFSSLPDGMRGQFVASIWTNPDPDRDSALDSQVTVHELTHGLSSRLHGNASGLSTNMARGMGEGWSDFYALTLLSEPTDAACGIHTIGGYVTYQITSGFEANYYYGIRRFPTARKSCVGANNKPHSPLTFRHSNSPCNAEINTVGAFPRGPIGSVTCDQAHNLGEIWSSTLWEVRGFLIDIHGAAEGNRRALKYVTDGMKLAPLNPTFLQERDAILTAAQVSAPADICSVWRGFAVRGIGFSASIQNVGTGSNNTVVTEAFDLPLQCRAATRADFDGDGKTDMSVFRPTEGNWYLNRSTSGFAAINWGLAADILVPGDYDGDNITDTAIKRAGDWYILRSGDNTTVVVNWGFSSDIAVAGDYSGDSKTDYAVFRPSEGNWYILRSDGGTAVFNWGISTDIPLAGDFDGDRRTDFTVYRNGVWYINQSLAGIKIVTFGLSSDMPVHADYDGDGKDDVAVFRPSDGYWYIWRSTDSGISYIPFGLNGDIPVPGDYDGDGKYDQAVYRGGIWYLNRSTSGFTAAQFGLAADVAIPNRYLP